MAKVGDKIRIISMEGEPNYAGKEGVVEFIDGIGQLHGTWGGLAVIPGEDDFVIIKWVNLSRKLKVNYLLRFFFFFVGGEHKGQVKRPS